MIFQRETANNETDGEDDLDLGNMNMNDSMLNNPINEDEVKKAIKSLTNNKAAGTDEILNEYIKCKQDKCLPIYVAVIS